MVWWWKPCFAQVFFFGDNFSSCEIHAGQFNMRISRLFSPAGSYNPKNVTYSSFTQSWWSLLPSSLPSSSNIKTAVLFLEQSCLSFQSGHNKIILNDSCPQTQMHTQTHMQFPPTPVAASLCLLWNNTFLNWLAPWQPKEGGHHGFFWSPSEGEKNNKASAYWRSRVLTGLFLS